MLKSTTFPNVFLTRLARRTHITPEEFEKLLLTGTKCFVIPSRPHLAPEMFSHRILRDTTGEYIWEISIDDIEMDENESSPTIAFEAAIHAEMDECLAPIARIISFSAFTLVPPSGPYIEVPVVMPEDSDFSSFGSDEAPWYDHAKDSGTKNAGTALSNRLVETIEQYRAAVPAEPKLEPHGKGHVYFALEDKAHRAWLDQYFDAKMAVANESDRQKIRAFAAFQRREGTTASINTYDGQIVTWGTGWGGLGWLGTVMARAVKDNGIRLALQQAGVRYRSRNTYDIVDTQTKMVITGKQEALEAMRHSLPLLYLLIKLARSPDTREAVADAQLGTFFVSAGDVSNANEIATQALFNMVSHLKHWQPGYAVGCLEWAVPQVSDKQVSPERDKLLAPLIGRYFYGKARGQSRIPDWKQFQGYWRHMKEDGLDCLDNPFIKATTHPTDDPFATAPIKSIPAPTNTTNTQPTAPARSRVLHGALLSRIDPLETIAQGRGLLRRGAQGASIRAIQQLLLNLGYPLPNGANGFFDEILENAVQSFQRSHHLLDDGVIGGQTLALMDAADTTRIDS